MTNRPVPPSRPWFMRRARLFFTPGLSLPYQLRISRTRSFIALPPWSVRSLAPAASLPAAGSAAAPYHVIGLERISHRLELRAEDPAYLRRVDLGVAVQAVAALVAVGPDQHVGEDVPAADGAAAHREVRLPARAVHRPGRRAG